MTSPQNMLLNVQKAVRTALVSFRAEAFDNIDVEVLLALDPMPADKIKWVGRHLLLNARSVAEFEAGRAILRGVDAVMDDGKPNVA